MVTSCFTPFGGLRAKRRKTASLRPFDGVGTDPRCVSYSGHLPLRGECYNLCTASIHFPPLSVVLGHTVDTDGELDAV